MNKWLRSMLAVVALSMPVLAPSVAFAEPAKDASAQKAKKKASAVTVDAKFSRFLLTPHGKIRGMLLEDGSIVRVHEGSVRDTSLKSGDPLRIEAKAKGAATKIYVHAKVMKGDKIVVDDQKKHPKGDKKSKGEKGALSDLSATGQISTLLVGPSGKVHGIVLPDGTAAYGRHGKDAQDLASLGLKKGDTVTVTGKGGSYALGRALAIHSIKLPNGQVKQL